MTYKALKGPVGIRNGVHQVTNLIGDQQNIMDMLDQVRDFNGGNLKGDGNVEVVWPLPTPGKCNIYLYCGILRFQNVQYRSGLLGFMPDGVCDPGGKTQKLMDERKRYYPPMPQKKSAPKDLAMAQVPQALAWAGQCLLYLKALRGVSAASGLSGFMGPGGVTIDPAKIHLKVDRVAADRLPAYLDDWINVYTEVIATLKSADSVFLAAGRDFAEAEKKDMNCFGQLIPAWAKARKNIWFGPDYLGLGPKCQTAIILHEAGHYVRNTIGHTGGERGPAYDAQPPEDTIRSAYVVANLASHLAAGSDARYGLAKPHE